MRKSTIKGIEKLNRPKKSYRKLWLPIVVIVAVIVIAVIFSAVTVFRRADQLMREEPAPFTTLSGNIMPLHDNVSFYSLDEHIQLSGWHMKSRQSPARANIVFIHDNGANRIQFGLETADLFSFLSDEGFNIFAFDLRHSGRSDGELSTYGYAEYEDVIAAMAQMKALSGREDFILYGVGSGTSAALLAWQHLPESVEELEDMGRKYKNIDFDRSAIVAMLLDTPVSSVNDYIMADLPQENIFDTAIGMRFIPSAVRMSSGSDAPANLIPLCSRIQIPVMMTRNLPDNRLNPEAIDSMIDERIRRVPDLTHVWETRSIGHLNGWNLDQDHYKQELSYFLDLWIARHREP